MQRVVEGRAGACFTLDSRILRAPVSSRAALDGIICGEGVSALARAAIKETKN